jgi:hypothetical protein
MPARVENTPRAEVVAAVVSVAQEQAIEEQDSTWMRAWRAADREGDRIQEVLLADAMNCGSRPGHTISSEEFGCGQEGEIRYI